MLYRIKKFLYLTFGYRKFRGVPMVVKRDQENRAAKQKDEVVGGWLSKKVIEAARQDLTGKKEVARSEDVHDVLSKLSDRLDREITALNERITNSQKRHTGFPRWVKR